MREHRQSLRGWLRLVCALLAPMSTALAADAPPKRELVVFAAASLRDALTDVAKAFETSHPGTTVALSFAGSQQLRAQIEHGARPDVFAAAEAAPLSALRRDGLAQPYAVFAQNELVVVVPRSNPAGIQTFDDLLKAKRLVVGARESPIGGYTERLWERAAKDRPVSFRAAIEARIVSRELNVRQVLSKVSLGEADAAVVYRTDALSAVDTVRAIDVPSAYSERAVYCVATLTAAPAPDLAKAFVAALLGAEGQRALKARGFLPAGQIVAP